MLMVPGAPGRHGTSVQKHVVEDLSPGLAIATALLQLVMGCLALQTLLPMMAKKQSAATLMPVQVKIILFTPYMIMV